MKYIVKNQEPQAFKDWKLNDKMYKRGKPNWKRVPTQIRNIIRISLQEEQGYICCYCERRLNEKDYHVEHLKPKDKNKYPLLQLDYNNLICSCQLELTKGEPRHCGNSKGSWYDENNFVSPLNHDCEQQFVYTADGHIKPSNKDNEAAKITIKKLQLDIDKLVDLRKKAIEPFIDDSLSSDELRNFVSGYLIEKEDNNGKYNEFFTTIKYLFEN